MHLLAWGQENIASHVESVPAGTHWKVRHVFVLLTTCATAGNRSVTVNLERNPALWTLFFQITATTTPGPTTLTDFLFSALENYEFRLAEYVDRLGVVHNSIPLMTLEHASADAVEMIIGGFQAGDIWLWYIFGEYEQT